MWPELCTIACVWLFVVSPPAPPLLRQALFCLDLALFLAIWLKWGMPQINHNDRVIIRVNGIDRRIVPGTYSISELIAALGLHALTRRVDVSSRETLPDIIMGNDSMKITGGEIMTTVHG